MAEIDIFDAFDACIDRLNKGESIDSCLRDYPQHANRLRDLLQTGDLVYRAQIPAAEVAQDKAAVRPRIAPSRTSRRPLHFLPMALAAVFALAAGGVLILSLLSPRIGNIFSNVALSLDGTGSVILVEPTSVAIGATLPVMITASPTAASVGLEPITTSVVLMTPMPSQTFSATTVPEVGLHFTTTPAPTSTLIVPTGMPDVGGVPLNPTAGAFMLTTFPPVPPTATPSSQQIVASPVALLPLSAGEIDDNARWDTYLQYRQNYLAQYPASVHDVDVTGRQNIVVTDNQGLPVMGALVQVYNGQTLLSETRTYATGETLFFPNAKPESRGVQSYRVVVTKRGAAVEFSLNPSAGFIWQVTLGDAPTSPITQLDVLFLLDATGSMADEIAQLQNNILVIADQIDALPGNVDVRYGLVSYRDRGDQYITQTTDFVADVGTFQANLSVVRADGGGDTPESLNEGLHQAVQGVNWRSGDTIRLVFLVADAAPHLDYPQDYDYAQEMVVAAARGIKIHPVASSGLTPDGEFIFRQLAQYTMGHFLFLTYQQGTSGAPGDSRPDLSVGTPSNPEQGQQGDYSVEQLDELVMRLITDEINALKNPVVSRGVVVPPIATTIPGQPQTSFAPVEVVPPTPPPTVASPTPIPPPTATPVQAGFAVTAPASVWVIVLLGLSATCLVWSYALNKVDQPKRKNDEIIEDE